MVSGVSLYVGALLGVRWLCGCAGVVWMTWGWPSWLAVGMADAAGVVWISGLSVRWGFASRAVSDKRSELMIFATLGLVGMALNSGTLYVATTAGLALPLAKGISAAIGFVANFIRRNAIIFSTRGS